MGLALGISLQLPMTQCPNSHRYIEQPVQHRAGGSGEVEPEFVEGTVLEARRSYISVAFIAEAADKFADLNEGVQANQPIAHVLRAASLSTLYIRLPMSDDCASMKLCSPWNLRVVPVFSQCDFCRGLMHIP